MKDVLLINVDEMWLKGRNRPFYYQALRLHIKELMREGFNLQSTINNEHQRLTLTSDGEITPEVVNRVRKIPGVHSVCFCKSVELDFEAIKQMVIQLLDKMTPFPRTFKVMCRRSNKNWPICSMEMNRELGHHVLVHFDHGDKKLTVDVKRPEVVIDIKIMDECAYISTETLLGVGGLPIGTSGHLVTLLSGGFDSPVASFLLARRGTKQTFAFFYSYPYVGDSVKQKIIQMASALGQYQRGCKLYIIPFGDIQDKIAKHCDEDYRTLLFRRLMIESSDALAKKIGADAMLSGDSLGQVSSQTIDNICYLDKVAERPIFRPLLGHNKIEIVNLSKQIGTHDISIIPHDDACSLFAPKHPVTRPNLDYLKKFAEEVDFSQEIAEALDKAEVHFISAAGVSKLLSYPLA